MDQIDGTIGTFTYQVHNFESANELVLALTGKLLEVAHLFEILTDLPQALLVGLLVKFLQQGDVSLEVFIVVSNVDKCAEEAGRKDHFERFPVFLDRVEESQAPQAVHLKLMLDFQVFTSVTIYVYFWIISIELWAVVHQETPDNMGAMQSYLHVVLIVQ